MQSTAAGPLQAQANEQIARADLSRDAFPGMLDQAAVLRLLGHLLAHPNPEEERGGFYYLAYKSVNKNRDCVFAILSPDAA